jgi:hypothetical protein
MSSASSATVGQKHPRDEASDSAAASFDRRVQPRHAHPGVSSLVEEQDGCPRLLAYTVMHWNRYSPFAVCANWPRGFA